MKCAFRSRCVLLVFSFFVALAVFSAISAAHAESKTVSREVRLSHSGGGPSGFRMRFHNEANEGAKENETERASLNPDAIESDSAKAGSAEKNDSTPKKSRWPFVSRSGGSGSVNRMQPE